MSAGCGVVEGFYAWGEGFGVYGLGVFFLFDGFFLSGEGVFECLYGSFDLRG